MSQYDATNPCINPAFIGGRGDQGDDTSFSK